MQDTNIIMSTPVGKEAISVAFVRPSLAYIANNSRTQRPSMPKFGIMVPNLRYDSHTSFKVKRSKVRDNRPINADTHPAPCVPNANLPLVVVVGVTLGVLLGHFRINLNQTCTQYSSERPQHCDWAQFSKSLSKSRILSPKTVICQFRPSKQQDLLLADGSIAMTSCPAHWPVASLAVRLPLLRIDRGTRTALHTSFKVKGQGHKLTSSVCLISASSSFGKQNAVPVSLEAGVGIPCRPNPAATLLVIVDSQRCQALRHHLGSWISLT